MHEMSLVQTLLAGTLQYAARNGPGRVVRVQLLVGQFSDENQASIRMYWQEFSRGTPAQDAELEFKIVAGRIECLDCGRGFVFDREAVECPACHGARLRVVSGEEVELGSIAVE